jgi:hypothetical protein
MVLRKKDAIRERRIASLFPLHLYSVAMGPAMRVRLSLVFLLVVVLLPGCEGSSPALYTVEGVLKHQGTPLPKVDLKFFPVKGGRGSNTRTDANGRFVMYYTASNPGAVPGEHIVYVEYYPGFNAKDNREETATKEIEEAIKKYGVRSTSPHRVTIEKDETDLVIDLP